MSYTKEERKQIAENILEYSRCGKLHYYGYAPYAKEEQGKEYIRYLDSPERKWLEVIAKDVLGEIRHNEEYWTSNGPA